MIKLLNIREGFATNSSSSHSLIFGCSTDRNATEYEFGWDSFRAGTKNSKLVYLALALRSNLSSHIYKDSEDGWPEEEVVHATVDPVVEQATGIDLTLPEYKNAYIDHESIWNLPLEYGGNYIDMAFFEDLKNYILQDDLAVCGGNDNGGDDPPPGSFTLPLDRSGYSRPISRKDAANNYWTLFDRVSGYKIRFMFEGDAFPEPTRASVPELVDMTITDYCYYGCDFCYRNCSTSGTHAPFQGISDKLEALSLLKVFEVAIGGGEPTTHPNFSDILRKAKEVGIVPNFSTRSLDWIDSGIIEGAVTSCVGAWAYSVQTKAQVDQLIARLEGHDVLKHKVTLNIPMGTLSQEALHDILVVAWANCVPVTLLGFKDSGRGKVYDSQPYDWWLSMVDNLIEDNQCPKISIDTALAAQYDKQLQDYGISRLNYEVKDGTFSMYLDAVKDRLAADSYTAQDDNWYTLFKDTPRRMSEAISREFGSPLFRC